MVDPKVSLVSQRVTYKNNIVAVIEAKATKAVL